MTVDVGQLHSPRQEPLEVAPDTFLIRAVQCSLGGSLSNSFNSLFIRAAEPVIVDTGMVINRDIWFDDLFSLVEPNEVRWIFATHLDDDHIGNLTEAIELCPNANVVINWAASGRLCSSFDIPRERIRTVDDGETLDVGDRTLRAVRPPVYDSAHTRGLLDTKTGVYYAADAFCAPMPAEPVDRVDQMPALMWERGMAMVHHYSLCPWISMVDEAKFQTEVKKLAGLNVEVIVGAHTPLISASSIERAFDQLAALPSTIPPRMSASGVDLLAAGPMEIDRG
jgi:flavorubredoxin